jgi:hypothetical protein
VTLDPSTPDYKRWRDAAEAADPVAWKAATIEARERLIDQARQRELDAVAYVSPTRGAAGKFEPLKPGVNPRVQGAPAVRANGMGRPMRGQIMSEQTWYKVALTDDLAGARRQTEIQNEFEQLYTAALGPKDVGMYSTGMIGDSASFCVYFSPATSKRFGMFLQKIGAEPCARPTDARAFLVGHTATMREMLGYVPSGD